MDTVIFVLGLGVVWTIWAFIVFFMGTTPGKQILGLRVISTKTIRRAGWWRMFLCEIIIKWIPVNIGYGVMLFPMALMWLATGGEDNNPGIMVLLLYGIPGMWGGLWLFVNGCLRSKPLWRRLTGTTVVNQY